MASAKSFGINGIIDSTFGIGESNSHIALQPDGKIIVLGWYYPGFILIRYNSDGSLDDNFGDNGKVITIFGAGTIPTAVALQADGKIVTAGNYGGGVGSNKFLLARYTTEGILDEPFGNKGVITNDDIKISPNPATNTLQIQGLPLNQKIKLTVVDFAGNVAITCPVYYGSQQLTTNSSSYNLNIASLKQGDYLLKIETNDDVVTKKFVKE